MESLLATKLFIPPARPELVQRPRLVDRLNRGQHRKLTLISAPAGSGKTTLVTEWLSDLQRSTNGGNLSRSRIGWISLEKADNDPIRFLTYFITVLKNICIIDATTEQYCLNILQPTTTPDIKNVMSSLIGATAVDSVRSILVLDDYHLIEARPILDAVNFFIEHMPPHLQMVIVTREDPDIALSRLRANDQLNEIRNADLSFTNHEAHAFLNQVMHLNLSNSDIDALDSRTEGWIAGLQLAAISIQGLPDPTDFIDSFTGSHHFVVDYLLEEVLQQQSQVVYTFLLSASCLEKLCGDLCDYCMQQPSGNGQRMLEYLDNANLFIIPLDHERRWYRYHHLFADLLRQRAQATLDDAHSIQTEMHTRASEWYENAGEDILAFQHAVRAGDIQRATILLEGKGMPLHFRGAIVPVLTWLETLSPAILNARPSLWVMYASALSMSGELESVEEKLKSAETALSSEKPDENNRNLFGHIAAIRALLAASRNEVDAIIEHSNRALQLLHPNNLPVRNATTWKLGIAYQIQGKRREASRAFKQAIAAAEKTGNTIINISASTGLGNVQESQLQLIEAFDTYQCVLRLAGEPPSFSICEALLGLARIHYQWNELEPAEDCLLQCLSLTQPSTFSFRPAVYRTFLAKIKLARGKDQEAADILAEIEWYAREQKFIGQLPELGNVKIKNLLKQGNFPEASIEASFYNLPLEQTRITLAQGDIPRALHQLKNLYEHALSNDWQDELLTITILQALARYQGNENKLAFEKLEEALNLARAGGVLRAFLDEGTAMISLLQEAILNNLDPVSAKDTAHLLASCYTQEETRQDEDMILQDGTFIEALSPREMEILRLIAAGLSNHEISQKLFLALSTVKGHNKRIFNKLQAKNRTEAVLHARQAGWLES